MVDFNALPKALQKEIANVMAMEGDAKKIDSRKEYDELGKLLNGTSGKEQRAYIEDLMFRYEEAELVSPQIRERVREIVKNADATKADDNLEIEDLKKLLKTKGLSAEDKKYIKDVIKQRAITLDTPEKVSEKTSEPSESTKPAAPKEDTKPKQEAPKGDATGNVNIGDGNGKGNVGSGKGNVGNVGRDQKVDNGSAVGNNNKTNNGNHNHQDGTGVVNGDGNSVTVNTSGSPKQRHADKPKRFW